MGGGVWGEVFRRRSSVCVSSVEWRTERRRGVWLEVFGVKMCVVGEEERRS